MDAGQIICFERNPKTASNIKNFLRENRIFNCVVANFQNCVEDFILEEGGFILTKNGLCIEKKGIAEEIARLKGPIIFYGGRIEDRRIIAIKKPMMVLNREDSFYVEDVLSAEFISAYWMLSINMIYKESATRII